ncbi:MAG: hypothetical protein JNL08_10545 [Planctomycetes bacterium]|nr:hypothetical protein [Planctomycetota bacterium]
MNDADDDVPPREAVVDVLLAEAHGAWAPRDVADAVLARHARGDMAPVAGSRSGSLPFARRWLAAALVLLGLVVVGAVTWSVAQQRRDAAQEPVQDPAPDTELPVADLAQLRALLPQVVRVELDASWLADPDLPHIELGGVPVVATADWQRAFLAALATDAQLEPPAGWKWQNRLSLVLGDRRRIVMAIDTHDHDARQTLGLRGLRGDLSVGGAAALALRDLLATATHVARQAHGVVVRPQDLDGANAFPTTADTLRLFGLQEADLQHLPRYSNLRHLDVSGLRHPLGRTAVRHLADCASLAELTAEGVEFPDQNLIRLTKLTHLRRLHLRGVTGFTGEGFTAWNNSALRRDPTELVDLRSVASLTDAGLVQIAGLGAAELRLGGAGGGIGDEGWRALAASRGLQRLDLSAWRLDAARLGAFASSADLAELTLDDVELDDAALAALAVAPALRAVSLRRARGFTHAGVIALGEGGHVRRIDLTAVDGLDLDELAIWAFLHPDVEFVR